MLIYSADLLASPDHSVHSTKFISLSTKCEEFEHAVCQENSITLCSPPRSSEFLLKNLLSVYTPPGSGWHKWPRSLSNIKRHQYFCLPHQIIWCQQMPLLKKVGFFVCFFWWNQAQQHHHTEWTEEARLGMISF